MTTINSTNATVAANLSKMQSSFTQYVLSPLNAFGLGGLVFDIEGETTVNLSADITDHYLEDNSSVQDNIAIRPERITFTGYAGDVVFEQESSSTQDIQKVVQKLTVLSAYLPSLAKQSQQVFNTLTAGSQKLSLNNTSLVSALTSAPTLNNIANIWAAVKNLNPSNGRQKQIYNYLKALMEQKILISLQTPFEFSTNMAIESIYATQDETTRSMSVFTIALKKVRVATIQTTVFNPLKFQNTALPQNQPVQQLGNNQGRSEYLQYLDKYVVVRQ